MSDATTKLEPCRSCGTTSEITRKHGGARLCPSCGEKYRRSYLSITEWLLRRLRADIERLERGELIGRCEVALTHSQQNHQCAAWAATSIDGHKVCARHAKRPEKITWVSDTPAPHYTVFVGRLVSLANNCRPLKRELQAAFSTDEKVA